MDGDGRYDLNKLIKLEIRQWRIFTLPTNTLTQDANSAFPPFQSVLNFCSTASLHGCGVVPQTQFPPTPPLSFVRYANRPFGRRCSCTKRLASAKCSGNAVVVVVVVVAVVVDRSLRPRRSPIVSGRTNDDSPPPELCPPPRAAPAWPLSDRLKSDRTVSQTSSCAATDAGACL